MWLQSRNQSSASKGRNGETRIYGYRFDRNQCRAGLAILSAIGQPEIARAQRVAKFEQKLDLLGGQHQEWQDQIAVGRLGKSPAGEEVIEADCRRYGKQFGPNCLRRRDQRRELPIKLGKQ